VSEHELSARDLPADPVTDASADEPADAPNSMRDTYRQQLLDSIGGWTGTVITAIPPVVFVVVNAIAKLRPAIIAAVGTAVVLTVYRLVRRQSIQQAVSGLIGVVIAALIAARTGQARGYFLLGIWSSFAYGAVFAGSVLVRRPIVGLLWEFLDPTPAVDGEPELPWYRRRPLARAYLWATLGATAVFAARGVVQLALFRKNATGWLAFARIAMGYPLWVLAVAFGYWVVRRARRQLGVAAPADAPAE
jgi:hypothetical protein